LLADGQPAWVVVGAEDYAVHREGCLFLAGLRDAGRAYNTERTYASRVALYLSYCAFTRISWSAPTVWQLARFLHWLVDEPVPWRAGSWPSSAPFPEHGERDHDGGL
jgi:hypothetical protein